MAGKRKVSGILSFDNFYRGIQTAEHATYHGRPHSKVRSPGAFEEQKKHLSDLYAGVTVQHSFLDRAGQIFDCIPIDQQPALKKSGKALATPPSLPRRPPEAA